MAPSLLLRCTYAKRSAGLASGLKEVGKLARTRLASDTRRVCLYRMYSAMASVRFLNWAPNISDHYHTPVPLGSLRKVSYEFSKSSLAASGGLIINFSTSLGFVASYTLILSLKRLLMISETDSFISSWYVLTFASSWSYCCCKS